MDGDRFDALTRAFARGASRRRVLQTLAGSAVAGLLGLGREDRGEAYVCRAGGVLCLKDAQCCSGSCDPDSHQCACTGGQLLCRDRCIAPCAALDQCHVAGECDAGSGRCTNPPATNGTACGQGPRCADGVATGQDVCDGSGTCTTGPTTHCTPYVCGDTTCLTSCGGDDSACIAGDYCAGSQCVPKLGGGAGCTAANQCQSGFCVDGVCCDGACGGQCETCNFTGSVGTCAAATGAPVGNRPACASDGSVCGGACDGTTTQACTYPGSGTSCRSASCSAGTETFAAGCDGAGACGPPATQPCGAYLCGATACLTTCSDDNQCVSTAYCDASSHCQQDLANGTACSRGHQCTSGNCVDGVCCDTTCTGQCGACNMSGHVGTCSPVNGAPVGGRPACASDGSVCGGTCNGTTTSSCTYPTSTCRAASCSNGTGTLAATCDGAGHCPSAITKTCAPYVCSGTACLAGCTTDGNCVTGDYCNGGRCVTKLANGVSCNGANQCVSGNCVGSVCCDSACTGPCQTCASGTCGSSCSGGKTCQNGSCACPAGQTDCSGTCSALNTTQHCGACGTTCPSPCGPYYFLACNQDIDGQHYFCGAGGYCKTCQKDSDCLSGYRCVGGQTPVPGCEETTLCIATC